MNVTPTRVVRRLGLKRDHKIEIDPLLLDQEAQNLSIYDKPPTEVISLQEFEEFGRIRLKALRKLENLREKYNRGSNEFTEAFRKEVGSILPLFARKHTAENAARERRIDRISHFVLRMAFCSSAEQSRWFLQQEVDLFRLRFALETPESAMQFLRVNEFDLEAISPGEKRELASKLAAASNITEDKIEKTNFWRVKFVRALEAVRSRRVLVQGGYAYVTFNELANVVAMRLRMQISKAMAKEAMALGMLDEGERLIPLLRLMTKESTIAHSGPKNANEITPDQVDELAKTSFPPCMRQIHLRLRADHHLRHFARRQYGLFLKTAGMSLESSLAFFRHEFTKKIEPDKFNKEYAYNVRHMYGKEGGRREGQGMDCRQIVLGNAPAAQDCHGCPFKHCEPEHLAQKLEAMGLNKDDTKKAVTLAKMSQYDKACAKFFEAQHKMPEGALGQAITHPNKYFELSRQIIEGKRSRTGIETKVVELETKNGVKSEEHDDFGEEMEF
uniref:DNA primase large subunit n=1 Tax=Panagrellus redivivus TaxID=6233 RepID=A0A7E4V3S3_PANRE